MNYSAKILPVVALALVVAFNLSTNARAGIVNIDFNGQRSDDMSSAGTFVGAGAAGGGTIFNGVPVISAAFGGSNNDNQTVTANNLLSDTGLHTTVGFTVSAVGGDSNPNILIPPGPPAPTSGSALFQDYFFNPGSTNFTISGLVPNSTVDVYTYTQFLTNYSFSTGAPTHFTPSGPFTDFLNGGNTLLWGPISVSAAGTITGQLPATDTIAGLTISGAGVITTPEPSTFILGGLGLLGLIVAASRRKA